MRIAVIIVIYNKNIFESKTLNTLLSYPNSNDLNIYVLNNGPKEFNISDDSCIFLKKSFRDIEIENHLYNKPLSKAYNDVIIKHNNFERYVILDDDTELNSAFLDSILLSPTNKFDVLLPKIISSHNEKTLYPRINNKVISNEKTWYDVSQDEYVYSIGSGLVISRRLVDIFERFGYELFDERFALYGVDISFFRRLSLIKKKEKNIKITINSEIFHSLSSVEEKMTDWRYKERLCDLILSTLYYSKWRKFKYLKIILYIFREIKKGSLVTYYLYLN
jgi:GT2 family glycosyltransferase